MTRSTFLKKLLASIAIGKLPVFLTKDFRKIYLLQCFVAGFRFYEGMQKLHEMKEGDLLELIREPENEHDPCAIALHWRGSQIGFIPADMNEMLSMLMDADALSLFGVITHLEKDSKPWENVAIAIYFVQEVNKDLPAHASYLTRIEAPHYRTLKRRPAEPDEATLEELFETSDRVINIDEIPPELGEARDYIEKYYSKYIVQLDRVGRYVRVPDDGIYNFMYEVRDDIKRVKDTLGNVYLEFNLGLGE